MYKTTILLLLISTIALSQKTYKVKLKNTVKYGGFLLSLSDEKVKIKTGYLKTKDVYIQMSIQDQNFNGIFNDVDKDYITITYKKNNELRVHNGVTNSRVRKENIILANNEYYKITKIDPKGEYLLIKECVDCKSHTLKLVNKLPDLTFKKLDGTTDNFKSYANKGKYVFVEFWGTWCHGCIQILPSIKEVYYKHSDELIVIYMNSNDLEDKAKEFIIQNKLNDWVNGFATEQIEKELLLNGYPYGVLFDKYGKVIKFATSHNDLVDFFNDK